MRHLVFSTLGRVLLFAVALASAAAAVAAEPYRDIVTDLTVARDQTLDRLNRLKACRNNIKRASMGDLEHAYTDARIVHNATLDAWADEVRAGGSIKKETPRRVAESLQSVRDFLRSADSTLETSPCYGKVGVGKALFWLLPMLKDVVDAVASANTSTLSPMERDALRDRILGLKLARWTVQGPELRNACSSRAVDPRYGFSTNEGCSPVPAATRN